VTQNDATDDVLTTHDEFVTWFVTLDDVVDDVQEEQEVSQDDVVACLMQMLETESRQTQGHQRDGRIDR
jgi:hypothetical protein